MRREELGELVAFLAVCEERSFTRAATQLGTSQSSLSHTVKRLEERLDIRLLTRTTRKVSPTKPGELLAATLRPAFNDIEATLRSLDDMKARPTGLVRISSSRHAALDILWPRLSPILHDYPDVRIEIDVDQKFTDIVAGKFDAGVRLGDNIEKDMIALKISPDMRMIVYGSPSYFQRHGKPETPYDLTDHKCINLRMPTYGEINPWEFEKDGKAFTVKVDGPMIANDSDLIVEACIAGEGLCFFPDFHMQRHVDAGTLVPVLDDWSPLFPGYYIYYTSRMQASSAFSLILDRLRYRA